MTSSSVVGQITDRMVALLMNATDAQDRVFDSRAAAVARDETPCIAITPPKSEESKVFGRGVDEKTVVFTVEVLARGEPWRKVADPVVVDIHRLLMSDAELLAMVVDMRSSGREWEDAEADQTAGTDAVSYRLIYQTSSNDLTTSI